MLFAATVAVAAAGAGPMYLETAYGTVLQAGASATAVNPLCQHGVRAPVVPPLSQLWPGGRIG